MNDTDIAWKNFLTNGRVDKNTKENVKPLPTFSPKVPEASELYISTQTKIGFLNQKIPLFDIFWKLPIIPYHIFKTGIVKKQIKYVCANQSESQELNNKIQNIPWVDNHIITFINNPNANKVKYRDIRKLKVLETVIYSY